MSSQHEFRVGERAWRFSPGVHAQRTADTTLSIDQIAIGGRGSVRGFDGDVVLLAENGYAWRNELTTPLSAWPGADLMAVFALDHGRVWGASAAQLSGQSLTGAALGLRGRHDTAFFEAMLAFPLRQPMAFASRQPTAYLSLSYAF